MLETNPENNKKWLILLAVGMGVFLATIDGGIVNIGLNTLVKEFNKPLVVIEWVVLAYMLTISSLMLSIGRLGDMIGKKKLFLAGLITFTLGSLLCGFSGSIYWLIAFRVLQAVGGAVNMALGTAIVTEAFPDRERGKALGILGTLVLIGIIAGPTIGGVILESLPWNWLFFVNLPVGIIGVIMVLRYVPAYRPGKKQHFDFRGALVLFVALVSLLFALSSIQSGIVDLQWILVLFGVFITALGGFIVIEKRTPEPMIDLSMFHNRMFSVNLVTGLLVFVVTAGTMILLPLYLQNILNFGPRQSGLMLAITPVCVALVAPFSGALSDRVSSRLITAIGLVVLLTGFFLVSTLNTDTTVAGYLLRFIPVGIGIGLFQAPNNSAIMGSAPRERSGVASSLLSLNRTIGQTTGIALLGAFWERRVASLAAGAVYSNVTLAPVTAQVEGLRETIHLVTFILATALSLSICALVVWLRQKRNPSN